MSVSASRKGDTALVSATNLDPEAPRTIRLDLRGASVEVGSARVLTAGALDAHNTPEAPDAVTPIAFSDWSLVNGVLELVLPRSAYVTASLELDAAAN
nr:alpha-L-arabinofuranosidase C-terminal domain-containing protein [Actinomyces ruminis]